MELSPQQIKQLMAPLNAGRVAKRKQGNSGRELSYLESWDVKAHLIRVFGFGGWSAEVLDAECVFAEKGDKNWDVAYKVRMQLTVQDAVYTEVAIGSAHLPDRGEAHDMSIKTAESDALKRAAINLGTQFGLSLYNNGSRNDVVVGLLDPTQVLLLEAATDGEVPVVAVRADVAPPPATPANDPAAEEWLGKIRAAMNEGMGELVAVGVQVSAAKAMNLVWDGKTIGKYLEEAQVYRGKKDQR